MWSKRINIWECRFMRADKRLGFYLKSGWSKWLKHYFSGLESIIEKPLSKSEWTRNSWNSWTLRVQHGSTSSSLALASGKRTLFYAVFCFGKKKLKPGWHWINVRFNLVWEVWDHAGRRLYRSATAMGIHKVTKWKEPTYGKHVYCLNSQHP